MTGETQNKKFAKLDTKINSFGNLDSLNHRNKVHYKNKSPLIKYWVPG